MANTDVQSPKTTLDLGVVPQYAKEPKVRFEFRITAKPNPHTTIEHFCDSRTGSSVFQELTDQTYDEILSEVKKVLDEVKNSIA